MYYSGDKFIYKTSSGYSAIYTIEKIIISLTDSENYYIIKDPFGIRSKVSEDYLTQRFHQFFQHKKSFLMETE